MCSTNNSTLANEMNRLAAEIDAAIGLPS